ncbi:TolB family protein [Cesiribacter andamanensis]|uniref:WD40-like Beta Propeller Repeat protein n=1 Tax=Cesiribacter andamanensis AMV16 TaxID=1279009 RepID=M7N3Y8_9BACT|nr:PD40 domain-containing protein [Cesiribacter andamanensis]EMR02007.1 WD40-like Beta Propeller Repeat protein [Cesiribacter andamanensis AMV16]
MKNIFRILSCLSLCLTAWLAPGLTARAQLQQDTTDVRNLPIPLFKNVNRTAYYSDAKKLDQIKRLEQKQDWPALYKALKAYVNNFGIQNFYKDTYYLWRLAKLSELVGNPDEARMYYRLVLKHHRSDIDLRTIELHYNELNKNEADLYVPLEYYYELVDYRRQVDTLMPPRSVLLNMGENVNSYMEDYGPTLNFQNTLMILTSKRNVQQVGIKKTVNEDLYFSELQDGVWSEAEPLEGINSQFNEGSATISRDGKTIYFSRCDSPDSYGSCDLFMASQQPDGRWGGVKNLGANLNSIAWDSHPSLSQTEDTLYFASDRIGGFGMSDIWYSVRSRSGEWGPARNAGPVVNTRHSEVSPFIHPRYNILYFSSNGQNLNFGEFDIFKSYWKWGRWGEPINIGPLVNGAGSEFYFTIDSEARDLYYAASKQDKMKTWTFTPFRCPWAPSRWPPPSSRAR